MFFTKEDFEKIEKWLGDRGGKDSSFEEVTPSASGDDYVAIIQDGLNKKATIKSIGETTITLNINDDPTGRSKTLIFSQKGVQDLLDVIRNNATTSNNRLQGQIDTNRTNIGNVENLPYGQNAVEAIIEADNRIKENKKNIGDVNLLIDGEVGEKNTVDSIIAVDGRVTDNKDYIDEVNRKVSSNKTTIDLHSSQIAALENRSDIVDVVKNYAALQSYDVSKITDNDIVKVLKDENRENAITYYRYHLDNIPSKWEFVGSLAAYYTIEESDAQNNALKDLIAQGYVYEGKITSLSFLPDTTPKVSSFWTTNIRGTYTNLNTSTGKVIKNNEGVSYIKYDVESDTYSIVDTFIIYQDLTGNSPSNIVSQKAIQDALDSVIRSYDCGKADTKYGGVAHVDCGYADGTTNN